MYRIGKDFAFSAAHQLAHLPNDHPCSRMHGHNYLVTLEVECSDTGWDGFVVDYRALAPFGAWIDECLDHRVLNDVVPSGAFGTTAERLAVWLATVAERLLRHELHPRGVRIAAVTVRETPKTFARYEVPRD